MISTDDRSTSVDDNSCDALFVFCCVCVPISAENDFSCHVCDPRATGATPAAKRAFTDASWYSFGAAGVCTGCGAEQSVAGPGAVHCVMNTGAATTCKAGYFVDGVVCSLCPAGTYKAGVNTRTACDDCPVGTYNPNEGGTSVKACIPCDAGRFSNRQATTAASQCLRCPAGECCSLHLSMFTAYCFRMSTVSGPSRVALSADVCQVLTTPRPATTTATPRPPTLTLASLLAPSAPRAHTGGSHTVVFTCMLPLQLLTCVAFCFGRYVQQRCGRHFGRGLRELSCGHVLHRDGRQRGVAVQYVRAVCAALQW